MAILAIGPPGLGWQELAIVLVIALLFFGGRKLPELGSSIGRSIKNFKRGIADANDDDKSPAVDDEVVAEAPPPRAKDDVKNV